MVCDGVYIIEDIVCDVFVECLCDLCVGWCCGVVMLCLLFMLMLVCY